MSRKIFGVEQSFNYYIVYYKEENNINKYYVTSIYRGEAKYMSDYLYARAYKYETACKVAAELQRKATIEYRLERCRDCVCLVAGDNGEWICDECDKFCNEIGDVDCPELDRYEQEIRRTEI